MPRPTHPFHHLSHPYRAPRRNGHCHGTIKGSGASDWKRATRKFSLTAFMLGLGCKGRDKEREKECYQKRSRRRLHPRRRSRVGSLTRLSEFLMISCLLLHYALHTPKRAQPALALSHTHSTLVCIPHRRLDILSLSPTTYHYNVRTYCLALAYVFSCDDGPWGM